MKFQIWMPNKQVNLPRDERRSRVFIEGGQELVCITEIGQRGTVGGDTELLLAFGNYQLELVEDHPSKLHPSKPTMTLYFARWTTPGGFGLTATVAAHDEIDAVTELGLCEFEKLEGIEAVGTVRGERYTRATVLSRESL